MTEQIKFFIERLKERNELLTNYKRTIYIKAECARL